MKRKTAAQRKVAQVMRKYKGGKLRTGTPGKGGKVISRKQAIAIALSEAERPKRRGRP